MTNSNKPLTITCAEQIQSIKHANNCHYLGLGPKRKTLMTHPHIQHPVLEPSCEVPPQVEG